MVWSRVWKARRVNLSLGTLLQSLKSSLTFWKWSPLYGNRGKWSIKWRFNPVACVHYDNVSLCKSCAEVLCIPYALTLWNSGWKRLALLLRVVFAILSSAIWEVCLDRNTVETIYKDESLATLRLGQHPAWGKISEAIPFGWSWQTTN